MIEKILKETRYDTYSNPIDKMDEVMAKLNEVIEFINSLEKTPDQPMPLPSRFW